MIDTERLKPKISPLDIWRIGASFIFLGFGAFFIVTFLLSLARPPHRTYTQLLLGVLILAYGAWRLWSGWRNWRRMRASDREESGTRGTR